MKKVRRKILGFVALTTYALHSPLSAEEAPKTVLNEIIVASTPLEQTLFESAQPVTVLDSNKLFTESKSTIGETLSSQPGITSTSFGPGAGRPIIRGLGGDRIRILKNGVGTQDVSNSSPDHAIATDSLLADKIEVVRGPATLMYGSSAVGGVVNILDNRIPEELPQTPVTGKLEARGATANDERAGAVSLTSPISDFAVHVEAFARKTNDLSIPGFARTQQKRIDEPELEYPEPKGKLPFSDTETNSMTVGTSYIHKDGYIGIAGSLYNSEYGVPNGENDVSIDMRQPRLDIQGKLYEPNNFLKYMNFKLGLVSYKHTEFEGPEVGTIFKNRGIDGRYELAHEKIGAFEGIIGLQMQTGRFSADGEEAFQPNTATDILSAYIFEEAPVTDSVKLQFGVRTDSQSTDATRYVNPITEEELDLSRDFTSFSQSAGAVWTPFQDYSLALSVAHTERAPGGQELFANGPHVATGAYEIGNPDLDIERSIGIDLTLRKREGRVTGSVGGFVNRFNNYIGLNPTGKIFEGDAHGDEEHDHEEHEHEGEEHDEEHHEEEEHEEEGHSHTAGLPIYQFESQDVDFYGIESEIAYHFLGETAEARRRHDLTLKLQPDWVWARDRDTKEALARIPPFRLKTVLEYRKEALGASLEVMRVFNQDRTADFETETDGYTMLNATVSHDITIGGFPGQLFLRGENLTNDEAREHVSFIKDVAPLAGRNVLAGIRLEF